MVVISVNKCRIRHQLPPAVAQWFQHLVSLKVQIKWLTFIIVFSLLLLVSSYAATYYIFLVGSMSDGYQDPSINVLQNSMAISDSSVMCPVGMQRQVAHMIPAPGFSHHQFLPPNPVYPNGAGYLNGESNVIQQVHEQKPMPFSINQSSYPIQHLGTHVGSGVHSRILEDSSPYGLSDPQINGDVGLPDPNMQLPYRTVAAKEFMNLPLYGNSPEKPMQQEFICHLPQGTPSMCAIFFSWAISPLCYNV